MGTGAGYITSITEKQNRSRKRGERIITRGQVSSLRAETQSHKHCLIRMTYDKPERNTYPFILLKQFSI